MPSWESTGGCGASGRTSISVLRLYRWDQATAIFERLGFTEIEMRVFDVRSNGQRQAFWFARRA